MLRVQQSVRLWQCHCLSLAPSLRAQLSDTPQAMFCPCCNPWSSHPSGLCLKPHAPGLLGQWLNHVWTLSPVNNDSSSHAMNDFVRIELCQWNRGGAVCSLKLFLPKSMNGLRVEDSSDLICRRSIWCRWLIQLLVSVWRAWRVQEEWTTFLWRCLSEDSTYKGISKFLGIGFVLDAFWPLGNVGAIRSSSESASRPISVAGRWAGRDLALLVFSWHRRADRRRSHAWCSCSHAWSTCCIMANTEWKQWVARHRCHLEISRFGPLPELSNHCLVLAIFKITFNVLISADTLYVLMCTYSIWQSATTL